MAGPYRKPTLVGEMNILRRLRELGRRNSANWHRNFGRRCAPSRWRRTAGAQWGRRESVAATVY